MASPLERLIANSRVGLNVAAGSVQRGINQAIDRRGAEAGIAQQEAVTAGLPEQERIRREQLAVNQQNAQFAADKAFRESTKFDQDEALRVALATESTRDNPAAFSALQAQNPVDLGNITQEDALLNAGLVIASSGKVEQEKTSALQEKVDLLISAGIPRERAIGIASGQLVTTRDPQTGEANILDKATGLVLGATTPPAAIPSPAATPPIQVGEALGAGAVLKTIVNKVSDLFGGDLPFNEASIASSQLSALNNQAIQTLRAGVDGKPNVELQRRMERLLVEPNQIFGGEAEAKNRFQALIDLMDGESTRLQSELNIGGLRPNTKDKIRQKVSTINSLSSKYQEILSGLDTGADIDLNEFLR